MMQGDTWPTAHLKLIIHRLVAVFCKCFFVMMRAELIEDSHKEGARVDFVQRLAFSGLPQPSAPLRAGRA